MEHKITDILIYPVLIILTLIIIMAEIFGRVFNKDLERIL